LKRALLASIVLGVGVVAALGAYADFGQLGSALQGFQWELLPLALACTAMNHLIRFWRWQRYLRAIEVKIPARRSFSIFTAGLTMTLSPAKLGEVLKSVLLARSFAIPARRSAPIVLAERITDAIGLAALTTGAGVAVAGGWALGPPVAVLCLASVFLLRLPVLDRYRWIAEARSVSITLLGWPRLTAMSVVATGSWLLECVAAWVCVRGLGLEVSFGETVVVFGTASLAGAISFVPGGIGVAEASMAALLRALGASRPDAVAATVLIRLVTLWFSVAGGLIALAYESSTRPASESEALSDPNERGA
jgi:uncharacterized membrane protein YbhN (UPF0104 family)